MSDDASLEVRANGLKGRAVLMGGLIGAVTGMGVAFLIAQRAERQGGEVSLSTGEGLRLGLLVLGMLRQVADLASPDEE
jgi:hypothetical protein